MEHKHLLVFISVQAIKQIGKPLHDKFQSQQEISSW